MSPRRRGRLTLRVYAFVAVLAVGHIAALLVLPRYTKEPRYLEPQAAIVQYMVDRWSLKQPAEMGESFARVETRIRGQMSLFDGHGALLRSTVQPPLDAPTPGELSDLE